MNKQITREDEIRGRIAVIKSGLINAANGWVFLTDKELQQHEDELADLEEELDQFDDEVCNQIATDWAERLI